MAGAIRWAVVASALFSAAATAQQGDAMHTASVTYLGRDWLFIDAGSADGLRVGSEAEIVRRGRAVAVLRVESIEEHQANCAIVSRQRPVSVGDSVRFTPVGAVRKAPVVAKAPPIPAPTPTPAAPTVPAPPLAPAVTPAAPAPVARTPAPSRDTAAAIPPRAVAPPPPAAPVSPPAAVATPAPAPRPSPADTAARRPTPTPVAPTAPPRPSSVPGIAAVTYLSGAEIYVSAGRREGLLDSAEVSVMRHDSAVATLKVRFLASHQAACALIRGVQDIVVGDVVRFTPHLPTAGPSAQAATAQQHRPHRLSGPGLHGRIGIRYLRATASATGDSTDTTVSRTGFNQPSFDVRMNGLGLGGTPLGLSVDLRTRRTVTSSIGQADIVDGKTRVYQAAVFWGAPGAALRTVVGRQYLSAVSSVGLYDGGLVEINGSHFTFGAFGGLEPDAASLGFSTDIADHGGYLQVHSRQGRATAWSVTSGVVRSFEASAANREFGFAQATASGRHFSFYALQEVDYYPPYKVQLGEKQFSFTSQYATGLIRPTPWLSFNGSFDKRRSVRLYRDTQNPETAFDDAYRQGYGGGLQLMGKKFQVAGDWRRSTGGAAGAADSYTGILAVDRLTRAVLGFSLRATWYQNQNDTTSTAARTTGQLYSLRLGLDALGPVQFALNGGIRSEDNPNLTGTQQSTWFGVDLDASVARYWLLSVSLLRQKDPANPGTSTTNQFYGSVTWRF